MEKHLVAVRARDLIRCSWGYFKITCLGVTCHPLTKCHRPPWRVSRMKCTCILCARTISCTRFGGTRARNVGDTLLSRNVPWSRPISTRSTCRHVTKLGKSNLFLEIQQVVVRVQQVPAHHVREQHGRHLWRVVGRAMEISECDSRLEKGTANSTRIIASIQPTSRTRRESNSRHGKARRWNGHWQGQLEGHDRCAQHGTIPRARSAAVARQQVDRDRYAYFEISSENYCKANNLF